MRAGALATVDQRAAGEMRERAERPLKVWRSQPLTRTITLDQCHPRQPTKILNLKLWKRSTMKTYLISRVGPLLLRYYQIMVKQ